MFPNFELQVVITQRPHFVKITLTSRSCRLLVFFSVPVTAICQPVGRGTLANPSMNFHFFKIDCC